MPRGPAMLGVEATALTAADRARLAHPLVGGAILFARNYVSRAQLTALTNDIRALRSPALVIGVDHEGGRVQRFRDEFTSVPPMHSLGESHDADRGQALAQAESWGGLIADELASCGVDFSLAGEHQSTARRAASRVAPPCYAKRSSETRAHTIMTSKIERQTAAEPISVGQAGV